MPESKAESDATIDRVAEAIARALNCNPSVWDRLADGTWRSKRGLAESIRADHRRAAVAALGASNPPESTGGA